MTSGWREGRGRWLWEREGGIKGERSSGLLILYEIVDGICDLWNRAMTQIFFQLS